MSARVSVLTTGGTIASRPAPQGGVQVAVPGGELVAFRGPGEVRVREVMLAHSFNLTRADVLHIAGEVLAELDDPEVDGVVVTHGTDTMEETAYLLDLVLPPGRTVVFTGAQRHASAPDADGPRNIADAVRVAAAPQTRGLGALIVMAGQVHAARYATKAHTLALEAFASPGHGPVAHVVNGRVEAPPHPTGLQHGRASAQPAGLQHGEPGGPVAQAAGGRDEAPVRSAGSRCGEPGGPEERIGAPVRPAGFRLDELGGLDVRVDVVPVYLDADGVQVAACRAAGARGLVLEALGTGNPTPGVLREIRACIDQGITVLVTSRCAEGPAVPVYGAGGGADLAEAGAVFAGALGAPKARMLLMAALAAETDPGRALARLRPHLPG